jgi:cation transport regulator ChaB
MKMSELPSTLKDSPTGAKRVFLKTYNSAAELYGDSERARRTAFAALKYSFEKVGDQWKRKARPGPSDPRSTKSTREKRLGKGATFGGLDYYGHSKAELYKRARALRIDGRSKMSKWQLARAIA